MPKTSERSTGSACSQPIVCKVRQLWAVKIALWPMSRWSRTPARQSGSIVSAAPELRQSAATAASAASASHFSSALHELGFRLMRLGQVRFVDRPEHPVALLDVLRLRVLEIIEGPEQRQQPLGHGRGLAQHVRRIDHHHRVELEPDRPRLDVADARQEQSRQAGLLYESPFLSCAITTSRACSRGVSSISARRARSRGET